MKFSLTSGMRYAALVFVLFASVCAQPSKAGPPFEADLDGSGEIDFLDLLLLTQQWQTSGPQMGGTQVGWEAELVGTHPRYGVSGKALVTSATGIRLENFNFLNNGPDVFVYLIIASGTGDFTQTEGEAGFAIFPFSNNPTEPFENVTMDIALPSGAIISPYTHISVWCRLARADFGSGKFFPPGRKQAN